MEGGAVAAILTYIHGDGVSSETQMGKGDAVILCHDFSGTLTLLLEWTFFRGAAVCVTLAEGPGSIGG